MKKDPLDNIVTAIFDPNPKKREAAKKRVAKIAHSYRCPDCGAKGEKKGHQDCQFPGASEA